MEQQQQSEQQKLQPIIIIFMESSLCLDDFFSAFAALATAATAYFTSLVDLASVCPLARTHRPISLSLSAAV